MTDEADRHHIVCAAFVMLLNDERQVLLARRAQHLWSGGSWMFPAGHMESGETIVDAARREAREEVGIEIANEDVVLGHVIHHRENHDRMSFFFTVTRWSGAITNAEPDKCDELKWFPLDELPPALPEYCAHALTAAITGDRLSVRDLKRPSQAPG